MQSGAPQPNRRVAGGTPFTQATAPAMHVMRIGLGNVALCGALKCSNVMTSRSSCGAEFDAQLDAVAHALRLTRLRLTNPGQALRQ
jgi:hypothetical protein